MDYHPNVRNQVRRAYLQNGPCQPKNHKFPNSRKGRKFNHSWFKAHEYWLEYSISKDRVYCLCCYLFKSSGANNFADEGFCTWSKKSRLQVHVGDINSAHNEARKACEDLLDEKVHIDTALVKQTDETRRQYGIRLRASIQIVRILLRQGLAFRGNDEGDDSANRGNFLEILAWLGNINVEDLQPYIMENAPKNLKLTSPDVQKDITSAFSFEIIAAIIRDIGDSFFSILVDESKDISSKEQMAIVLRYVKEGRVIERFVGIEHVATTTALSLKKTIANFFSRHNLSFSQLRGQGYDGANNMKGEYNGLKKLILDENESAYFIHCFAHQLQLAVVNVAKKDPEIKDLFSLVTCVTNVVGGSPKRLEILRKIKGAEISEALSNNELETGRGLNQESNLKRAADTRWGSHQNTLISLINLYSVVMGVLRSVLKDKTSDKRFEARGILVHMKLYNFAFRLHLMKNIMGVTNDLSEALQRKNQDIVNAMKLVRICKTRLQEMRDNGWNDLLSEVSSFCEQHKIKVVCMNDSSLGKGREKRNVQENSNEHKYRIGIFNAVIDLQLRELNDRFTETNTELLLCVACLCPSDSFAAFDKDKLKRLAEFYPKDFSEIDIVLLDGQLQNYIMDVRTSTEFSSLNGITDLARKMVETKKDKVYSKVYLLLTLALILPVATASVERLFSAMKILKNRLRNRMGDEWLNDCLLAYVEKVIMDSIVNDIIMNRFHIMKPRKGRL
ncbi:zinc finger MYM-type protein 1-like [Papaver somniferum]|uniref:zinc finger MYM-type protein 1-like n=1 Tax=Papaver somniferum TaxID=3469 RepID=UPI000E6F58E1|nr:zinc finger MYM-type protein 1-like [Papaver somniferum]